MIGPFRLAAPVLLAALLCGGCASLPSVASSVALGPGGRAEGRIASMPVNRLRLVNRGPGRVDFVLRGPDGEVLCGGSLGVATSRWAGDPPAGGEGGSLGAGPLVLVLEAYRDEGGAVVEWELEGEGGAGIDWDLSRAHP